MNKRSKISDLDANFLDFMEGTTSEISIDPKLSSHLFAKTGYQASRAKFFGSINVAMRMHCIKLQEQIIIMRQYSFLPALIGTWWNFENKLYDLANQVSQIFEERSIKEYGEQPLKVLNQTYFQVVRFGFNNWSTYVLGQKLIKDELLSAFKLIESNPMTFPFHGFKIASHILSLFEQVKEKEESRENDLLMLSLTSTTLRLFLKHKIQYDHSNEKLLTKCSYLADMLPLYLSYAPDAYIECRDKIINKLKSIQESLDYFSSRAQKSSNDGDNKYLSVFDSYEYNELMIMIFRCDSISYMNEQIPNHVKIMKEIFKKSKLNLSSSVDSILSFYTKHILPIYRKCEKIVMDNFEARKCFAETFKNEMFPPHLLSEPKKFFTNKGGENLHCVWTMCRLISDYVILISDAFIAYYKPRLDYDVAKNAEESLQECISEINAIVDREFEHDQITVLARSSLYIPHQNDAQLVGRARGLIEQAHEPSKMRISIRELFDIVPFVKSRKDLFASIGEFIQNQLLSQIEPNVELEQSLLNSMGQYTEYDLIDPLKKIVKEFAGRFNFFNSVKDTIRAPPNVKISLLSNQLWKTIIKRGTLAALSEFDDLKERFENEYMKRNKAMKVIWCDPSSLVEVKLKLQDSNQEELFLFNGVQFSMLKAFERSRNSIVSRSQLRSFGQTEDAEEQIDALVYAGLLVPVKDRSSYTLATSIPVMTNRNFAKKYTSAENIALRQLKEQDIVHSVACCIVRLLKTNRDGLTAKDLVHRVIDQTIKYFSVQHEVIREVIRDLEIKKFIKYDLKTNKLIYI